MIAHLEITIVVPTQFVPMQGHHLPVLARPDTHLLLELTKTVQVREGHLFSIIQPFADETHVAQKHCTGDNMWDNI